MVKVTDTGAHIVQLSTKHNVDPFVVLGLLALHALAEVDFGKLAFWKDVSKFLTERNALAA